MRTNISQVQVILDIFFAKKAFDTINSFYLFLAVAHFTTKCVYYINFMHIRLEISETSKNQIHRIAIKSRWIVLNVSFIDYRPKSIYEKH